MTISNSNPITNNNAIIKDIKDADILIIKEATKVMVEAFIEVIIEVI